MKRILLAVAASFCFCAAPALAQPSAPSHETGKNVKDGAAIANAFSDAIESLNLPLTLSMLADNAVIWHNYDGKEHPTRTYFPELFARMKARGDVHKYADRRYISVPDGAILQHNSTHTTGSHGEPPASSAVMQHMYIRDGRIVRIEEYFDRSQSGLK